MDAAAKDNTQCEKVSPHSRFGAKREGGGEGRREGECQSKLLKNRLGICYKHTPEKTCCFVMGILVWETYNYERQVNQVNHSFLWNTLP